MQSYRSSFVLFLFSVTQCILQNTRNANKKQTHLCITLVVSLLFPSFVLRNINKPCSNDPQNEREKHNLFDECTAAVFLH